VSGSRTSGTPHVSVAENVPAGVATDVATAGTSRKPPSRVAAGVDGFPEGNDAVVLAMALTRATNAELMLVAVHSDPLVLPPVGVDWTRLHKEAHAALRKARAALAPSARIAVETDVSVPRALQRVVHREHRDLLVMGSSRHGPEGRVRIGKRTRQLLGGFECPLAVAPRGLHRRPDFALRRVAVGYDGGEESQAALELAGAIAVAAGAELRVQTVVDDRLPPIWWSGLMSVGVEMAEWEEAISDEVERRRAQAQIAARATGARVRTEVSRGRPAAALLTLSEDLDLLVVGSRRWGPVARLLLGSTGEALLHDSACAVLVVPRPAG
jgi:nucleotide-binding universal stress UspA family protein